MYVNALNIKCMHIYTHVYIVCVCVNYGSVFVYIPTYVHRYSQARVRGK